MDRLPGIAGWILGLLLLVGLSSLIPEPRCRDGWESPSIGRQGACSHHGGVERHEGFVFLAIATSFCAGLITTLRLTAWAERRKKARFIASLVRPEPDAPIDKIVLYAILSESKIEFMYKGRKDFTSKLRIVTRKATTANYGRCGRLGTLYLVGHCHSSNANRTFAIDRISGLKLHGA